MLQNDQKLLPKLHQNSPEMLLKCSQNAPKFYTNCQKSSQKATKMIEKCSLSAPKMLQIPSPFFFLTCNMGVGEPVYNKSLETGLRLVLLINVPDDMNDDTGSVLLEARVSECKRRTE